MEGKQESRNRSNDLFFWAWKLVIFNIFSGYLYLKNSIYFRFFLCTCARNLILNIQVF